MQRYTAHQFWVSVESAVLTAVKREVRVSPLLTAALIRNGCAHPQRLRLSATAALIRNGCAYPQRLRSSATAALIRNGCAHPQRLRSSATAALIRNGCAYHNGCAYPQRLCLSTTAALTRSPRLARPRIPLAAACTDACTCAAAQPQHIELRVATHCVAVAFDVS
jgi:hypothetical protein